MVSVSLKRPYALAVATSVIFVVGFAVLAHLVPGGELFGSFMVIPLCLIAWGWGARIGFIAALVGTVYTEAVFSPEYFIVHHQAISPYWFMIVVAPAVFLFLGRVVGRLGDTLRELSGALEARKAAEEARQLAESRYKDLIDFAPEAISVIQDSRPMLLNRKALERTGDTETELKAGRSPRHSSLRRSARDRTISSGGLSRAGRTKRRSRRDTWSRAAWNDGSR